MGKVHRVPGAVRGAVCLQHCFPTESSHESKFMMGTQNISQTDVWAVPLISTNGSIPTFVYFYALDIYTGLKEYNSSICLSVWQPAGIYSSGRVEGQSKTGYSFWAQQCRVQNWFYNSFSVYEKYIRSLHLNVLYGRCKHLQETILRGWIGKFHFSNV